MCYPKNINAIYLISSFKHHSLTLRYARYARNRQLSASLKNFFVISTNGGFLGGKSDIQ
jgi:hypothetical protein